jgi:porin
MKVYFIFVLSTILYIKASSQDKDTTKPLNFEASYVGESFNNLSGGIKRGSTYQGMANLRIGFDTDKARLWKGGQFYINAANTHGGTPSCDLVGDFQVASNIEAGNHTYIQEFWFKQTIGALAITAGLQDLNVEFVNSENSATFLNSSFGIMPTISGNIPTPIFPLTSLGISLKWQMSEATSLLISAFDGCPTDFEDNNPYNLKWNFQSGDGILAFAELQHSISVKDLPGTYKLGLFSHYNHRMITDETTQPPFVKNNYGFYFIADQTIWHRADNSRRMSAFMQMGCTPEQINCNRYYTGAGLNLYGLWNKSGEDVLGLAIARAGIDRANCAETTLELTYQLPVTKNLFLQPDLQYIMHPVGTEARVSNSFSAIFRFGFTF